MLQLRINILERVTGAESLDLIGKLLHDAIQCSIRAGFSTKRIRQAISLLESDMLFQLRLDHCAKEQANIKEALRILRRGIQPDFICVNT